MTAPRYYLRLRDVLDWCGAHGITVNTVRESIRLGMLTRHRLNGPNSKAHYRRDEVAAVFGLPLDLGRSTPPAP